MSGKSKRLPHARGAALTLLAALFAATSGCGQSGPLTLPGKRAKTQSAPAPAPAQERRQDSDKKKDKSDASGNGR